MQNRQLKQMIVKKFEKLVSGKRKGAVLVLAAAVMVMVMFRL